MGSGPALAAAGDLIPVLWLCGPPGVGKTTVGWEIFTQLTQAGMEAAMDASDFADLCVDTSGRPAAEVTRLVRERIAGWPILTGPGRPDQARPDAGAVTAADGPILMLCGATGVGKSTAGFEVYVRTVRAGSTAAYIDLDQIGFCRPVPPGKAGHHRVKAASLAAIWPTYRAAGAQCLIAVGPVENEAAVRAYAGALPRATITLCRLHAGADELTRRIMLRGQGGSWPQPGDPLAGQPAARLLRAAASAAADAAALEHSMTGRALRIDTDGLTVQETADAIAARTGWPRPEPRSRPGRW